VVNVAMFCAVTNPLDHDVAGYEISSGEVVGISEPDLSDSRSRRGLHPVAGSVRSLHTCRGDGDGLNVSHYATSSSLSASS